MLHSLNHVAGLFSWSILLQSGPSLVVRILIYVSIGLLGLAIIVGLLALTLRKRHVAIVVGGAGGYEGAEDLTQQITFTKVLATLNVRESASLMPGQPFDIDQFGARMGSAADNDIVVPDPAISRLHAEIRMEDGKLRLFDLDSEDGTQVNGTPVGPQGAELNDGDELSLGTATKLKFMTVPQDGASVTSQAKPADNVPASPAEGKSSG